MCAKRGGGPHRPPPLRRTARSPNGEPAKMLKVCLKLPFNRDPDRVATQQLLFRATAPRTQPASQHRSRDRRSARPFAGKRSEAPILSARCYPLAGPVGEHRSPVQTPICPDVAATLTIDLKLRRSRAYLLAVIRPSATGNRAASSPKLTRRRAMACSAASAHSSVSTSCCSSSVEFSRAIDDSSSWAA
jgi:hypothetical protein